MLPNPSSLCISIRFITLACVVRGFCWLIEKCVHIWKLWLETQKIILEVEALRQKLLREAIEVAVSEWTRRCAVLIDMGMGSSQFFNESRNTELLEELIVEGVEFEIAKQFRERRAHLRRWIVRVAVVSLIVLALLALAAAAFPSAYPNMGDLILDLSRSLIYVLTASLIYFLIRYAQPTLDRPNEL